MKYLRVPAVIALCITLLFSTVACRSTEKSKNNQAMGRYVEYISELPVEGSSPFAMLNRSDGTVDAYFVKDNEFCLYNSKDGEQWIEKKLDWKVDIKFLQGIAYGKDDQPYFSFMFYGEEGTPVTSEIKKMEQDGSLTEIPIEWQPNGLTSGIYTQGLYILDNGDILTRQSGAGLLQFSPEGKFKGSYATSQGSTFIASGDKVFILDRETTGLLIYDGNSRELKQTIPVEAYSDQTRLTAGTDGSVYAYGKAGVFRHTDGGELWEKIIDGELTSLSIPSNYVDFFVEVEDHTYICFIVEGDSVKLARYVYDKNVATLPEKELVVYALEENPTLRQAAGLFQRKNPNTRVNVQIADAEGAATRSDLIRTLNMELAAGKGPDVLILDDMPVDSYIEKGVLTDLSGLLAEIDSAKELQKSVVETYKNKDGIYAIPTKYQIPVFLIDEAYKDRVSDLNSAAAFAAEHQELGILGNRTPESLMRTFLPVCMPAWVKGDRIDEKGFTEFLEDMKLMADSKAVNYPLKGSDANVARYGGMEAMTENANLFHYSYGRAHGAAQTLSGTNDGFLLEGAIQKRGGGALLSLPGQVEKPFIPNNIVGINAKSQQKEAAEELIKLMLSKEVQGSSLYDGFGIRLDSLDGFIELEESDTFFAASNSENENEMLESGWPEKELRIRLTELWKSVKTPAAVDSALMDLIIQETDGFFKGETTVAETTAAVKEKTKLYLSE